MAIGLAYFFLVFLFMFAWLEVKRQDGGPDAQA